MSQCNEDEDCSVYNGHFEVEVLINRPVGQVWKQFLDVSSWVISHDIENASGVPGTLGSITRVSPKNAKEQRLPPAPYHYCKIIKLVPERQYVLKTYPEKGGSYGMHSISFDDTRFVAIDGKTKVTFSIFFEVKSEAVAKDPAAINVDASREGMVKNLNKLKQIVESR
jgi:hypothetical protein